MLTIHQITKPQKKYWKGCWPLLIIVLLVIFILTTAGCMQNEEPVADAEPEELRGEKDKEEIKPEPEAEVINPTYYIDPEYGTIPLGEVPIGARIINFS
jgi:hypothetical protein